MSIAYRNAAKGNNKKRETILKEIGPKFGPSQTKQAFKDSCDINKILAKARAKGVVTHLNRHQAEYGDFTDIPDLLEAKARLDRANEIFEDLPGEIKREFGQNAQEFFSWANDPENASTLQAKLQKMSDVGDQRVVNPIRTAENMAALDAASAREGASTGATEGGDQGASKEA